MAIYKQNGVEILRGALVPLQQISDDLDIPLHELTVGAETDAEKQAERRVAKLAGVEFNGVMCSATSEDQHGLSGIWMQFALAKMQGQEMPPVNFHFENGSKLVLTTENLDDFKAVWLPFRMSFFPMPAAE